MNERFLRAMASLKLTLALFTTLGLLSALGTFFPQGEDGREQVVAKYGHDAYRALEALGILDAYHSWWFVLVIGMLAANLIACTWVRLPKVWRLSRETGGEQLKDPDIPKTTLQSTVASPRTPAEAMLTARRLLAADFPGLVQHDGPTASMVIAEKNRLALWGAYIVHLGLLLLAAGGVAKVLWGYTSYIVIPEGQAADVPRQRARFGLWSEPWRLPGTKLELPLPRFYAREEDKHDFQIHLDHFEVQYYKGGAPSLFRSDVKILRGGKPERAESLKVNEPMDQDGVTFYQASWGYDGLYSARFQVLLPGDKEAYEVVAPYRKRIKMLESGWELELTDFYPDADMVGPGKLANKSAELNNPAVRVKFFEKGKERAHAWFVYAFPEIQMAKVAGLKLRGLSVDPVPFTVLQANHDPGVPLALAGALTMLLGVFSSFYLFYRKVWILVKPTAGGGSELLLAGLCKRNKFLFQRSFDRLTRHLQEALG